MKRRCKHKWPTLTVDMPEEVIPQWLHYTYELLVSQKDDHPEEIKRTNELRQAKKVLLTYVE